MKTGCIIIILFIVIYYLVAYFFCSIDPNVSYSWYYGIWHGLFLFPNAIMGLFSDSIYSKAPQGTTAYYVFYYVTIVIVYVIIPTIRNTFKSISDGNT